jgi:hypothetical protein
MLVSLSRAVTLFSTLAFGALAAFYVSKYLNTVEFFKLYTVVVMALGWLIVKLVFGSRRRRSWQKIKKGFKERGKSATKPPLYHQHSIKKRDYSTTNYLFTSPFEEIPAAAAAATTSSLSQPLVSIPIAPTAEMCAQVALENHHLSKHTNHRQIATEHRSPSIEIETVLPMSSSPSRSRRAGNTPSDQLTRVAAAFQKDSYKINLRDLPIYQQTDALDEFYSPGYFEKTNKAPPSSSSSMEILEEEAEEPYKLYYYEEE